MNRLHLSYSATGILTKVMPREGRDVAKFKDCDRFVVPEEVRTVACGRMDESVVGQQVFSM